MSHFTFWRECRRLHLFVTVVSGALLGLTSGVSSEPMRKGGYAVGAETCGSGDLAFQAFQPDTIDGLRTDVTGRLYVARILKGTIALMKPNGAVEREIALRAKEPTNLAFGGSDGKTVFVTQRQGGFIESFRTDQPGREHCLQRGRR